jgi:hypothetical protein
MFDVCVIGPVARDINSLGGTEYPPQPGGAAYYSTMVYVALGLGTAVVTRVAPADEAVLLGELRAAGGGRGGLQPADRDDHHLPQSL